MITAIRAALAGAFLAAAAAAAPAQARTIFGNYGLDPAYCRQPTVRQTVVYIDDSMMVDGQTEWATKLDIKLRATLAPGERVSVVRLSPASGQSLEYWSGCWPGLSEAMRAAGRPDGMVQTMEAMFSKSPEAELSDQRKYFLRDFGAALTQLYNGSKRPARPVDAAAPPAKQILRALASDYGRFLHSRQTVRAIVYSDFAENSDLGSAFKPDPAQEATYGQRLGTYLHGGVFYGFGEGADVTGDPAFGETARAFWIAALRALQGTVEGIGPDLNLGEAVPVRAYDYVTSVDFDGQKLAGRLSLLTARDGTLVDSWIGIARLGSAALTGVFRCAPQCRLDAATLGHLVTSDSPSEAVELSGEPDALNGTIGVAGEDTLRGLKATQPDR